MISYSAKIILSTGRKEITMENIILKLLLIYLLPYIVRCFYIPIVLTDAELERSFDGIGAISGGRVRHLYFSQFFKKFYFSKSSTFCDCMIEEYFCTKIHMTIFYKI